MVIRKPGPRRVEAWIYGVINPLEEALERESLDGRRRDPGYRWRTDSLENLLALRGYLSRAASVIMDELVSFHPSLVELEKKHDELLGRIKAAATTTFEALCESSEFQAFVTSRFAEVCEPKTMLQMVAEDVVNDEAASVDSVEGSYRHVWKESRKELMKLREQSNYLPLRSALRDLEEESERMRGQLLALRSQLSEEFDIPPASLYA